jgi:PleD family two-component response regulator
MTTAFIICGALAREVLAIIDKYGWDADVAGVPAIDHVHPERIAPDVEKRILELRQEYERLIVVFGDCGSQGALDEVLEKHGIERIAGPHCYEMYGGQQFHELMEEEPGTFFLTDFMLRTFDGLILKSLGLDRYPELKDDYFRHYKRVVYLAQTEDGALMEKAQEAADYLELPLEVRVTGFNLLEERLVDLMNGGEEKAGIGGTS